jgi:ribosomal protein S18 acetylase RimI-like enzyme
VATPRRAVEARASDLEELLQLVRRDLLLREESPSGSWIDESVQELRSGARPGWYLPLSGGGGIAFYRRRGPHGYGHVHAGPGATGGERAYSLATTLLDALPADLASIDLGFTGLSDAEERKLVARLAKRPGSTVIERSAMERPLSAADADAAPEPPRGLVRVAVRDVTLEALADLDFRAFRGTTDELLIGGGPAEYLRSIESLLSGQLGRFLDEASTALLEGEPPRLVGALFTAERNTRRAIFLDLMTDPERRRRGFGRFLLAWGLRALWALGYQSVRLWVTESNVAARRLYESMGFVPGTRATIYRWDRVSSSPQAHSPR